MKHFFDGKKTHRFICAKPGDFARPLHKVGTLKKNYPRLLELNREGYDIYFVPNKIKKVDGVFLPRKNENIVEVRAVWQEDDNNWQGEFPIKPHYTVCTSPGHYHRYWMLKPGTTSFDLWSQVMEVMCTKWGSDPGAKDLARLMRVPGFYNNKRNCFIPEAEENFVDFFSLQHAADFFGVDNIPLVKGRPFRDPKYNGFNHSKNNASAYMDMLRSGEHIHTPVRGLMMMMANKGHDPYFTRTVLESMLQTEVSSNVEPLRINRALADMPAMIKTTWEKIAEEQKPIDITDFLNIKGPNIEEMEFPPGLAGRLCEYVYARMHHPSRAMAFTIVIGFLCSFLGRRFNILGNGLVIYQILFANTGFGKGQVAKMVQELTLLTVARPTEAQKYLAAGGFTSGKAINNELLKHMCRVAIIDEFGKYLESTSGDKSSVIRFLLEAYTLCGATDICKGVAYSSELSNTPDLFAPALSVIGLTNQDKSTNSLLTSAHDGFVPRCLMINLRDIQRKINKQPIPSHADKPFFEDQELLNLRQLREFTDNEVDNQPPSVITLLPSDGFIKYNDAANDKYNKITQEAGDRSMAGIISRQPLKALRIAALVEVCNTPNIYSGHAVSESTWEWALSVIKLEETAYTQLLGEADSSSKSISRQICAEGLVHFFTDQRIALDGEMKNFTIEHRRNLLFTLPVLKRKVRGNAKLKELGNSSKYSMNTIIEETVKFWEKEQLIHDVTNRFRSDIRIQKTTKIYQFNEDALHSERRL